MRTLAAIEKYNLQGFLEEILCRKCGANMKQKDRKEYDGDKFRREDYPPIKTDNKFSEPKKK